MIIKIVTDPKRLVIKSTRCYFTEMDIIKNKLIIQDMIDTAISNEPDCLGLAANQIGILKRIILIKIDGKYIAMINPSYTPVKSFGTKQFKEGCLSFPDRMHSNRPKARRYKKIKLTYHEVKGRQVKVTLVKMKAVIAQHEIDHLNGKLI